MPAGIAAEAAKNQGKFWEYHEKLFANQSKLGSEDLKQYARDLGLDMARFEADLANATTKQRVSDDMAEVNRLGVTATPAFFINGRFLSGAQPFDGFAKIINAELQRLNLPVPPAPAAARPPASPSSAK